MRIIYEIIGATVLLALVYAGIVQVLALIKSRKQKDKSK